MGNMVQWGKCSFLRERNKREMRCMGCSGNEGELGFRGSAKGWLDGRKRAHGRKLRRRCKMRRGMDTGSRGKRFRPPRQEVGKMGWVG